MNNERWVRTIAGGMVLATALLGYFHSKNWMFFTMFIGANLFQSGITNICPLTNILKKLGVQD